MSQPMPESPSFLRLNNILLYVYTTGFYPLSANGHLGCFHLLAIVNNAAVNMDVQISQDPPEILSCGCPEVELLVHIVTIFKELSCCFPQQLHHFTFPSTMHKCSNFSPSSEELGLDLSESDRKQDSEWNSSGVSQRY